MATTDDLMQDVFQNFLSAYHQNPSSSATNIIAFEAIGLSPGLIPSAPDGAVRAVEYVSTLADSLPDISTGVYERTMRTISVTYEDMLSVSQPSSANATAAFNALKAIAKEAFDNSTLGSANGPTTFKPAYAAPANWYDPGQQTNWLHYSYSTGTPPAPPPQTQTGGTVIHPPIRIIAPVAPWRLTMATTVSTPAPAAVSTPAPAPVATLPMQVRAATFTAARVAPIVQAPAARPAINIQQRVFENERWIPLEPPPGPPPPPQPVLQPQFSMSFDYCIVELSRPWLSGDFLGTPGWYVPGAHQGDYSSGPSAVAGASASGAAAAAPSAAPATGTQPASSSPKPESAATQPPNPGPFSVVPTAFIVIKSLLINATAIDGNSPGSRPVTAFGPFSLVHASGSTDTLSDPGIQLIAWICSTQPILPPDTDPAIVPPPPAQGNTVPDAVGTAVKVLENIFGSGGH